MATIKLSDCSTQLLNPLRHCPPLHCPRFIPSMSTPAISVHPTRSILHGVDGRIVWNEHNRVIGSKRSTICVRTVYFLPSTMPSFTCLRLSDVSVMRVTYFQFPNPSAFLPCLSARQHSCVMRTGLPNTGHRTLPNIWVGTFLVRNVHLRGMILNSF